MPNRFFDAHTINAQRVIDDYLYCKLVSLEVAIQSLADYVDGIIFYARIAKHNISSIPLKDGLTRDEAAAIYLYSMETGSHSVYHVLNNALHANIFHVLLPWFLYLKLIHTALNKLPSVRREVWRGVSKNVSNAYVRGNCVTWKTISSCSIDASAVRAFLKNKKYNTLFAISCKNGKIISRYSAYPSEQEVILMPGTQFTVKSNLLEVNGLYIIDLEELTSHNAQQKVPVSSILQKSESFGLPKEKKKSNINGMMDLSPLVLPTISKSTISCKKENSISTRTVVCPHCGRSLTFKNYIHGVISTCAYCKLSFVELGCPHCGKSNYWKNPHDYFQGSRVTCCYCARKFQHFNCRHCYAGNFWKRANYAAGTRTTCWSCKKIAQLVNCLYCNKPNIWTNNYEQGSRIVCAACKRSFHHLNCPRCKTAIFFSGGGYHPGSIIRCHSCQNRFQHLPCPHCSTANIWPTTKYYAGRRVTCFQCKKQFQHNICPYCQVDNYILQANHQAGTTIRCAVCKNTYQQINCLHCNVDIYSKNTNYPQVTVTTCSVCKKGFSHTNCPKCSAAQYYEKPFRYGMSYLCSKCNCTFQHVSCFHCNAINSWYGNNQYKPGGIVTCYSCKRTFQYLVCPHCFKDSYSPDCTHVMGNQIQCIWCKKAF